MGAASVSSLNGYDRPKEQLLCGMTTNEERLNHLVMQELGGPKLKPQLPGFERV